MSTRRSGTRSRSARRPARTAEAESGRAPTDAGDKAQLRVVRRGSRKLIKRTQSRRVVPFVILGGILSVAVVFGVLLEQVVLAQSAFKLASVRERVAEAEARHQRLLLEAAKLESSDRIEQFARDELGMVDPAPGQVEYMSADIFRRSVRGRAPRLGHADRIPPTGAAAAGSSPADAAP